MGADYPFGLVLDVIEVAPDQLWVLEPQRCHKVHVIDGSGTIIRRMVRDGEGPGEMHSLVQGARTPEGTVLLANYNVLHHLNTDGEHIEKVTLSFYPLIQSNIEVTEEHIIHAAGARGPTGNHPHPVFVYDRSGALVSSFHPSYPMRSDDGLAQSYAYFVRRGENLLVVNAAPLEVVEYAFPSGRELRRIVEPDSSLVQPPGEEYRFEVNQRPGRTFTRRHFPRVRYAELLEGDRLLVVSVFPRDDWIVRPDHLVTETPIDEFERSVWDVYDLLTGQRVSRTETDRAYIPFERASGGTILGMYFTRLDESVVVKLSFEPE